MVGDEAIGVISVQSSTEDGRFGGRTCGLLTTMAANIGSAIQNARLYRERSGAPTRWPCWPVSGARSPRRSI